MDVDVDVEAVNYHRTRSVITVDHPPMVEQLSASD